MKDVNTGSGAFQITKLALTQKQYHLFSSHFYTSTALSPSTAVASKMTLTTPSSSKRSRNLPDTITRGRTGCMSTKPTQLLHSSQDTQPLPVSTVLVNSSIEIEEDNTQPTQRSVETLPSQKKRRKCNTASEEIQVIINNN